MKSRQKVAHPEPGSALRFLLLQSKLVIPVITAKTR